MSLKFMYKFHGRRLDRKCKDDDDDDELDHYHDQVHYQLLDL